MNISGIREKINLYIYGSKVQNLKILKVLSFVVSLISIGSLFAYHGFDLDHETNNIIQILVEASFGYYVFHYLAKVFYDFAPIEFLKQNWFEGVMVVLLLAEGILHNAFGFTMVESIFNFIGLKSGGALSVVFLQFYLTIVVFFELSDKTSLTSNIKLHPSTIFMLSFLIIISAGTALLMMPEMTVGTNGIRFIDAFFTSVSATCVTGLAAVDTSTFFSQKGQFVIMMLMKLGGLNIVSFAYLAAFLNRAGFGLKQDEIIEDFVTKGSFLSLIHISEPTRRS
mgnify:CR=1 FL=1